MEEYKVVFLPQRQSGFFEAGTTVRDAALELGIVIESTCAGMGTCGTCKVIIKEGLCPPSDSDRTQLSTHELEAGARLSCRTVVNGHLSCFIPQSALQAGIRIMTEGHEDSRDIDSDTKKVCVRIAAAELGVKYFDLEEVLAALGRQNYAVKDYAMGVVRELARRERSDHEEITAVVDEGKLIAVEMGDTTEVLYGVAVDIGTTTVAAKLVDLAKGDVVAVASAGNPQATHGADVVTRIKYILENTGGLKHLHRLIITQVNTLVQDLANQVGISTDSIYKVILAGNTVMLHLAVNVDPRHMGAKPYIPAFQGPLRLDAFSLGVFIHPLGVVYGLPHLAGFVGSDITSVLTILNLEESDGIQLVIDMGTNGEMVLGSKERLLCCSSPAGPAWEGASISWGMRATRGAIERAEIDGENLIVQTVGNEPPAGICGSGLIDLVCECLRAGLILPSGRIADPDAVDTSVPLLLRQRIIASDNGERAIVIVNLEDAQPIVLTQRDIREVQLAKGAMRAGIELMMQELSISSSQISRMFIAGAFGNHIRGKDVIDLGLIPEKAPEKIAFIGNAALSGAEAVLRSSDRRIKAEKIAASMEYIEVADRPDFQERFVAALHFSM